MTIDFSATPDDSPTSKESDSPMFAPTPAWERGKKRRGFGGGRVAEEPRSFAPAPEAPAAAAETGAYAIDPIGPAGSAQPTESMFAGTPSYAGVTARHKGSGAPVAIAAGIILLGGLGAAGWYFTQSRETGIAQLTPGSPTTTTTTTTTTAASSDQLAQTGPPISTPPAAMPGGSAAVTAAPPATAPSAATTSATTTTTTRSSAPTHRTVTARATRTASRSAQELSADVSATAPAAAAPAPAPQVAPLVTVPPPAPAAPAAAAPATSSVPAPTQTPPQ